MANFNTEGLKKTLKRSLIWGCLILVVGFAAFWGIRFHYVYSDGVKAGTLNQFLYKGYVFKTYEGVLILSGYGNRTTPDNTMVQSNAFEFSVTDKAIADSLMHCSGKLVELHYKGYFGTLPWRGMQKNYVDKIISVKDYPAHNEIL